MTTLRPELSRIPVGTGSLFTRQVGRGTSAIVLHGGPEFDHRYLLPELDELTDELRLIYYDQRGRGRSARGVEPEDITLASDLADIDLVRQHYRVDRPTLLGHSWGCVLALEFAIRHPALVSHLILMNPPPVAAIDRALRAARYAEELAAHMDRQKELMSGQAYVSGDPDAVAARYRIHFKPALKRPEDYEALMARMEAAFRSQGSAGIRTARAVEDRLLRDTWDVDGYDLRPKLHDLHIPTLVIAGDHDIFPVEVAERIASAIPEAQLVILKDCGHFAYLECTADVRGVLSDFIRGSACASYT